MHALGLAGNFVMLLFMLLVTLRAAERCLARQAEEGRGELFATLLTVGESSIAHSMCLWGYRLRIHGA
jgi:hypothetical protein